MPEQEPEIQETDHETAPAAEPVDTTAAAGSLAAERALADRYLANWQRAEANFVNYKRRSEQEREEIRQFANSTLVLELLPFLDDLERALALAPPQSAESEWVNGMRMVGQNLQSALQRQGLTPIKAVGEPFDPRFHEAVRLSNGKQDIVVEEAQKGYMFRERVIRPAKVVVGDGTEA